MKHTQIDDIISSVGFNSNMLFRLYKLLYLLVCIQ